MRNLAGFVLPFLSGPISFVSSIYIMHQLTTKENRENLKARPKEQFLFAMSFLDACGSFALSFSTLPSPTSIDYPGYGTVATCEAQGFLAQLGFGVPLYNMALCVYYVFAVIFEIPNRSLMRWLVPCFHVLILGWIFSTAIAGIVLHLFNPAGLLGCWIHSNDGYRRQCNTDGRFCEILDTRDPDAGRYDQLFMANHVMLSWAIVILSMIALYVKVRCTESRSSRRSVRNLGQGSNGLALPMSTRTLETGVLYSLAFAVVYIPLSLLGLQVFHPPTTTAYKVTIILVAFMTPLQGFLNLLIFTSPVWLKILHELGGNCSRRTREPSLASCSHRPNCKLEDHTESNDSSESQKRIRKSYNDTIFSVPSSSFVNWDEEAPHFRSAPLFTPRNGGLNVSREEKSEEIPSDQL